MTDDNDDRPSAPVQMIKDATFNAALAASFGILFVPIIGASMIYEGARLSGEAIISRLVPKLPLGPS